MAVTRGTAATSPAKHPPRAQIVVVDDEPALRSVLKECFEAEDYLVHEAHSSAQLEEMLADHPIDLITLDIGLGTEDGMEIARKLRDRSDIGIIMVTGKDDLVDKVLSLEMGADDYITKPFDLREVLARAKSVLRRRRDGGHFAFEEESERFMFGGWVLDRAQRELITPEGQLCPLTASEFDLLALLVSKPNRVLSREQILAHTRGAGWVANDRVVDNQIGRLRRKMLGMNGGHAPIRSVRGLGYMLAATVTAMQNGTNGGSPPLDTKQE